MTRAVEILLVEDNPADVVFLREALEASGWRHHLHLAEDGVEALDYLNRRDAYADAPRPDLILMDLNTPRKSGCEVLSVIREDPALASLPVFIISGSLWERHRLKTLGIDEEHYIVKPIDFLALLDVVRQIQALWRKTTGEAGLSE